MVNGWGKPCDWWGRQVPGWGMQVRHSKVYYRRAGASLPSRSNRPMFLETSARMQYIVVSAVLAHCRILWQNNPYVLLVSFLLFGGGGYTSAAGSSLFFTTCSLTASQILSFVLRLVK